MVTAVGVVEEVTARFSAAGVDAAAFEARQLALAARDKNELEAWISRRLTGEPLQYILGEWEFWGLPFKVGEGVLIPQPDTEILVERALDLIKGKGRPRVLDLCAGSGCIGIAIAHECPSAEVTAVELYEQALSYLKQNIEFNRVNVKALRADVLSFPPKELCGGYDLIVSNPPYIAERERDSLSKEVLFEPEQALFAEQEGIAFYKAIADHWLPLLKCGGALAVEIGYKQAQAVREIFAPYKTELHRDYGGNDRVITLVNTCI